MNSNPFSNMPLKITTIVGARPQFIKAAVVSRAIRDHNRNGDVPIQEAIIHTGQHFDYNMTDVFFDELEIPEPDYKLGVNSYNHGQMIGRMLEKIEQVLLCEKPDWVLVFGDTNSTLAGALAAKKLHIKLAHVEAGLRSFNMRMPEEQNRLVADRLSDILFCPTENAVENLKKEGLGGSPYCEQIVNVGDVMYDAARFYSDLIESKSTFIKDLHLETGAYMLVTIHRAENTDDPKRLRNIFYALNEIAKDHQVVLPLHPRTKKNLENLNISIEEIQIVNPVSYLEMMLLERNCRFIFTDSGGMQKEAYFHQKPCLTLRDETEWVELVDAGVNFLVGTNPNCILDTLSQLEEYSFNFTKKLYGDGRGSKRIIEHLVQ